MPAKEPGFMERLQTAAKAKKAQLEKIRASAAANSAKATGRQAAQVAAAGSRTGIWLRAAVRRCCSLKDRCGASHRRQDGAPHQSSARAQFSLPAAFAFASLAALR